MLLTEIGKTHFKSIFIYNKSSRYFTLVINMLKKKHSVKNSDTFMLNSIKELENHKEKFSTYPLESDFWLFYIEDCKGNLTREMIKLMETSNSFKIVVGFGNFRLFRSWVSNKNYGDLDFEVMYGSNLAKDEFRFLYETTTKVEGSSKLPADIIDLLNKRYLKEPDSVFDLLGYLKNGLVFPTKADVVRAIGVGSLNMDSFVLSLLNSNVKTERGLNMFMKKRYSTLLEFAERSNPRKSHKDFKSSLEALLETKMLLLSGSFKVGYHNILPEQYENFKINYYMKRLEDVERLGLEKILGLLEVFTSEGEWKNESDIYRFLTSYVMYNKIATIKGSAYGLSIGRR